MFLRARDRGRRRPLKLLLPFLTATFQSPPDRLDNGFPDRTRIAEPDFAFGRMDVDVNRRGIEINEQERDRELAFHQRGVIALTKRGTQHRTFDGAAIHEDELLPPGLATHPGLPDQPAN